jgi:signal transduction histidine kinase
VTRASRYLLAASAFAALLGLSHLSRLFWSAGFDTTTLIILTMIASAWYGGAGPGLLVAGLFEATLDYYAWPPKDTARFIVIAGNRVVLFGSLVLFASSRRAAERRLWRQERELEQSLSAERAARAEAEAANRVKDRFLSIVSHELRTPLTAILGWATMLRRSDLSPDVQSDAIQSIDRNARAQARVIDNLLDLSTLVLGGTELDRRHVALGEIVRRVAEKIRESPEAADRELRVSIAETPDILGDADRISKAVEHLLSNALKFTPAGGVIDVHVTNVDGGIELRVQDSGVGIIEPTLANLFQPFWQGDRSITGGRAGLGMGLAIVRHIVALHGGTVTAASEGAGRGAAFTIHLPAVAAPPSRVAI